MSSENDKPLSEFYEFVESVKAKIPIDELYTKLTGEQFTRVDARPRAKIAWRDDTNPSLCFVPDKNILTDFTDKHEGSDKAGRSYNVLDILQKCGGAINFAHALQLACEIAKVEIPDKFKKKSNKELGNLPYNLGPKLMEVWNACQQNMKFFVDNPSKRPSAMSKFFEEEKNIPFNSIFTETLSLGILPSYETVHNILKGHGILRIGKDNKELNIYREELGNNAIVFPLYNVDGALSGLRFRQLDKKDFAEWIPVGHSCFYNAQRFKKRPTNRRIMIVEGEMNVIAYARAVYDHLLKTKTDPDEIKDSLDKSLNIIFSTGSKGNSVSLFKDLIPKVFYLQDHDVSEVDEDTSPQNHPILKTCTRVAKEINSDDLLLANWEKLPYIKKSFDLEDFLKHNKYDLKSILDIEQISLARYAVNCIKNYASSIKNEDNKREVTLKYMLAISNSLQYSQKEVFNEIAKKEFAVSDDISNSITSTTNEAVCGPYSIDQLGRIIVTNITDDGDKIIKPVTNFYMKINDEITYFSHTNNQSQKFYNVEVVINGKSAGINEVPSTDIVDDKTMKGFLATTASLTDLNFMDPNLRGKNFSVITSLMASIPVQNKKYIFSSLGRPFETYCCSFFRTEIFCLFPKVSVINGKIVENSNFDVQLSNKNALETSPFEFIILSDEEYRKAINLFWNDLRHVHDCNIIDSLISMIFDSCTRELQGFGVVQNEHGFPIYLAGQSGAYKTTAAIAAMSLLGKFKTQNDLLGWNGTAQSLEHQLIQIGTITHCVDDLKVEEMNSKEFINFFHGIYGGNTRTRLSSTADRIKGGNKLKCSIIITSEAENVNIPESIAARMLLLRIRKCSQDISAERKIHLDRIMDFYDDETLNIDLMRGVMPKLIEWAQKNGVAPYAESLKRWKRVFLSLLEDRKNNAERPADMVARLVAGFEQICNFIKHEGINNELEINSRFEQFADFWKKQIRNQIYRIEKQSSTYKVVDLLCQLINSESIGIKTFANNRWQEPKNKMFNFPLRDITYPEDKGRKILIVSSTAVVKAMNMQIDNAQPIIISKFEDDLKESGIIDMKDGKPVRYPIPDDKNQIHWNKPSNALAIDYDKLMEAYNRIKNND